MLKRSKNVCEKCVTNYVTNFHVSTALQQVLGSMVFGSLNMSTYKQLTYLKNNLLKTIDYKAGTIEWE